MQSADSSLRLSWWLLYQMPGKLQGFKLSEPLGFGWPDYLLPLLTSSSFIHWDASSRKPLAQKTTSAPMAVHSCLWKIALGQRLCRLLQLQLQRILKFFDCAIKPFAVNEEIRRAIHPASNSSRKICLHLL